MALSAFCLLGTTAQAGIPVIEAVLNGNPTPMAQQPLAVKDFGDATVGATVNGATETVTVTIVGGVATVDIDSITANGDFAVAGGSCVGATGLQNGDTCTLELEFTPTVAGLRTGILDVRCRVGATLIGVLGLVCDNSDRDAYELQGNGILAAIAQAVPMLGREGLTLTIMLIFAASLLGLRRKRRGP